MSDWTNLRKIMRDLSVAQGRRVPASLETVGDTAPPVVVGDETDEEYYKSNSNIDFSKPPDFTLIQEMLSVVRDKNETSKDDILLNSELNPLSPVFVPSSKSDTAITKIKRREKNIAISSILQAQKMNSPILVADVPKTPSSMFKKKSTPNKVKKETRVCLSYSDTAVNVGQYVPSALAGEYYNKYLANSKIKEQIQEDLWSRVEEQMKEIDKKQSIMRSLKSNTQDLDWNGDASNLSEDASNVSGNATNVSGNATNVSGNATNVSGDMSYGSGNVSYGSGDMSYGSGNVSYGSGDMSYGSGNVSYGSGDISYGSSTSSKYGMDVVRLLHHRHLTLDGAADCVVCRALHKHGYSFREEAD